MANPKKKAGALELPSDHLRTTDKNDNAILRIERTFTDEIVIGICAPIGSQKEAFIECLRRKLTYDYGYIEVVIPKLSKYIEREYPIGAVPSGVSKSFHELKHKIDKGDQLRRDTKKNSVLAEFAITEIHKERIKHAEEIADKDIESLDAEDFVSRKVFYIIDSLKNKDEVKLLRTAYRDIFYQFSIFSPMKEREMYLRDQKQMKEEEVKKLIATDEYEENDHGQDVRHVFTEGDFFVRMSVKTLDKVESKVDRYLKLMFGQEVVTPLPHELAMYEAQSAAGNSACLSRQVGAAITDVNNMILSTGWNDVPKFGGSLYGETDSLATNDHRCWALGGFCRSDREKDFLADDIIDTLLKHPKITERKIHVPILETGNPLKVIMLQSVFDYIYANGDLKKIVTDIIRNDTKVGALIEFSKAVHAEMHAIINGSQMSGARMRGGKLYCTTFPCHNCARHIIAAGISEVYYIEPYPKSLVRLHYEAISEEEDTKDKVKILMYDGVSPRRYLEFFSRTAKLKDDGGKLLRLPRNKMKPKFRITLQALKTLERQAIKSLDDSELT